MNRKAKELAEEMAEHADEATRLLNISNQIHQAQKRGAIEEQQARNAAIELNEIR
jgi:hypothetical protein